MNEKVSNFLKMSKYLLDIVPDGVVITLPSGEIAYVNPAAAGFYELDMNDFVGRQAGDINETAWKEISEIFENGEPQIGQRNSVKGKLYITSRLPLRMDGNIEAVVSFFQGIFVYDKVSLELESYKQMANLLNAIMDFSFDGLWITDKRGNVVKLNKAAERITGCTAEEVLGRNAADLVAEGYFDESVTLEVLKRKTTVTLVQKTKLDKKVLATGSPIFNSKGEIDVIIINDRDITVLDRMHKELTDSKALIDQYRHELSELGQRQFEDNHFICKSKVMEALYAKALQVAQFDSTVLLSGESGVGKGFLSRLIHSKSSRSNGPFIRVDCAAIVETLFESELFGYEKGAFTGAGPKGKPGLMEMADGGTLFLDEISEMPLKQQVKLLRFMDEKSFFRVGSSTPRTVDTRVIAATNKDLAQEVQERRFRKDLFFRLNVVSLVIPPLWGRAEDILDLVKFFLAKIGEKHKLKKRIAREVLDVLVHYKFPGNVRELQNLVESMMVISQEETITLRNLPAHILQEIDPPRRDALKVERNFLPRYVQKLEAEHILNVVEQYGSQREAARHLGVHQSTISRKLRRPQSR